MPRLVLGLALALSMLGCREAPPGTPSGTRVLDWASPQRFLFNSADRGFTQGAAIGEDVEHLASVVYEPSPQPRFEVAPVTFDVTYVVGERRMHGFDGTTFTARVPLSVRIVLTNESPWTVTSECGNLTWTPQLHPDDHPVAAFHDRTFFWQHCGVQLVRPLHTEGPALVIYGDGQLVAPPPIGGERVTITRIR